MATPAPPQRPGHARAAPSARAQVLAIVAQAGSEGVTRAAMVHAAQLAGGTVDGALHGVRQHGAIRRLALGRYGAVEEREEAARDGAGAGWCRRGGAGVADGPRSAPALSVLSHRSPAEAEQLQAMSLGPYVGGAVAMTQAALWAVLGWFFAQRPHWGYSREPTRGTHAGATAMEKVIRPRGDEHGWHARVMGQTPPP